MGDSKRIGGTVIEKSKQILQSAKHAFKKYTPKILQKQKDAKSTLFFLRKPKMTSVGEAEQALLSHFTSDEAYGILDSLMHLNPTRETFFRQHNHADKIKTTLEELLQSKELTHRNFWNTDSYLVDPTSDILDKKQNVSRKTPLTSADEKTLSYQLRFDSASHIANFRDKAKELEKQLNDAKEMAESTAKKASENKAGFLARFKIKKITFKKSSPPLPFVTHQITLTPVAKEEFAIGPFGFLKSGKANALQRSLEQNPIAKQNTPDHVMNNVTSSIRESAVHEHMEAIAAGAAILAAGGWAIHMLTKKSVAKEAANDRVLR